MEIADLYWKIDVMLVRNIVFKKIELIVKVTIVCYLRQGSVDSVLVLKLKIHFQVNKTIHVTNPLIIAIQLHHYL